MLKTRYISFALLWVFLGLSYTLLFLKSLFPGNFPYPQYSMYEETIRSGQWGLAFLAFTPLVLYLRGKLLRNVLGLDLYKWRKETVIGTIFALVGAAAIYFVLWALSQTSIPFFYFLFKNDLAEAYVSNFIIVLLRPLIMWWHHRKFGISNWFWFFSNLCGGVLCWVAVASQLGGPVGYRHDTPYWSILAFAVSEILAALHYISVKYERNFREKTKNEELYNTSNL